ncbi:MAG: chaperonin GroEL, partial [Anaerolineales bacterium]|nr:chaperonin GroEL [Anaerolineales bacterium]
MKTKLIFQNELQQSLSRGVDKLADAVTITLGPSGANVIIKQKDKTILTKDGISVARAITLEDDAEQLGLSIIREASEKTANSAGDGTTTSIVLARAIYKNALKYAQTGINPILLKRAIDEVCEKVLAEIKSKRTFISSVEDIKKVAFISSNGDEFIASLVSQAVEAVGKHGSITFKESTREKTELELIEGFSFDSGLISPQFITDERQMIARHQNPIIFITDFSISNIDFLMPVLELAAREEKPLVIIADDVNNSALAGLISGHIQGNMPIACIRAPRFGSQRENILNDLALATGGKFITKNKVKDLKGISIADFGRAETIDISRWKTIIAGCKGNQEKIKQRIEILEDQLKKVEKIEEATENKERINRLGSGCCD